jgi:hypothetical protein
MATRAIEQHTTLLYGPHGAGTPWLVLANSQHSRVCRCCAFIFRLAWALYVVAFAINQTIGLSLVRSKLTTALDPCHHVACSPFSW